MHSMFSVDLKKLLKGSYPNPPGSRTTRYPDPFADNSFKLVPDDFGSNEFRMYSFKIKKCPINRTHDWTVCPYAHRGERARRRDPRRLPYVALACPEFRATGGVCPRGELCPYAHGVFEYWLHPAKYRTRVCTSGEHCARPVCFFAHSAEQIRPEQPGHVTKWARIALRADAEARVARASAQAHTAIYSSYNDFMTSSMLPEFFLDKTSDIRATEVNSGYHSELELIQNLRRLRISDFYNDINKSNNIGDIEMPNVDWVSDLLGG